LNRIGGSQVDTQNLLFSLIAAAGPDAINRLVQQAQQQNLSSSAAPPSLPSLPSPTVLSLIQSLPQLSTIDLSSLNQRDSSSISDQMRRLNALNALAASISSAPSATAAAQEPTSLSNLQAQLALALQQQQQQQLQRQQQATSLNALAQSTLGNLLGSLNQGQGSAAHALSRFDLQGLNLSGGQGLQLQALQAMQAQPVQPQTQPSSLTSMLAQLGVRLGEDSCFSGLQSLPGQQQQQQSQQQTQQLAGRRSGRTLPTVLAQAEDSLKLSSHQVLLRHQIEAFEATEDDVSTHTRGRNKPITLGQVGIRCRHCAHLPVSRRQKGSTYFPATTMGLYQAAQNMSTTHMQCGLCTEMPEGIKQEFARLMSSKLASSGAGRPYWAESAKKLGLVDTEEGGIRCIRDPPFTGSNLPNVAN